MTPTVHAQRGELTIVVFGSNLVMITPNEPQRQRKEGRYEFANQLRAIPFDVSCGFIGELASIRIHATFAGSKFADGKLSCGNHPDSRTQSSHGTSSDAG